MKLHWKKRADAATKAEEEAELLQQALEQSKVVSPTLPGSSSQANDPTSTKDEAAGE
jgi:hypothetical protein